MILLQKLVSVIYRVAVLLTNCLNCPYPSQTSQYFGLEPPVLENHLGLHQYKMQWLLFLRVPIATGTFS